MRNIRTMYKASYLNIVNTMKTIIESSIIFRIAFQRVGSTVYC